VRASCPRRAHRLWRGKGCRHEDPNSRSSAATEDASKAVISLTRIETPGRRLAALESAAPRLSTRATNLAPGLQQRPVLAINGVFSRASGLRDGNQRFLPICHRSALIIRAGGRVGSDNEEVVACFEALMASARRKDRHIPGSHGDRASFRSSELDLRHTPGDAENFMGAGVIVNIIVNAVPPHIAPSVALKQLFKDRGRIKRFG
jgi:hypothetical protein